MTEQPEALRLADWCDAHSSGIYRPSAEAAAELRRLHNEVERLCAQRDALLEALEALRRVQVRNTALSKLSQEEREILGI